MELRGAVFFNKHFMENLNFFNRPANPPVYKGHLTVLSKHSSAFEKTTRKTNKDNENENANKTTIAMNTDNENSENANANRKRNREEDKIYEQFKAKQKKEDRKKENYNPNYVPKKKKNEEQLQVNNEKRDYLKYITVHGENNKGICSMTLYETVQKIIKNPTIKSEGKQYIIEATNQEQTEDLLALKEMKGIPIIVKEEEKRNTSKGVVTKRDVWKDDEGIKDTLNRMNRDIEVKEVKRFKKKQNEDWINTNSFLITFNSTKRPEKIIWAHEKLTVKPYIRNPLRCRKCQRYGHLQKWCRGKKICVKCGSEEENHNEKECTKQVQCTNCKGNHQADANECPVYQREKEIQQIIANQNISFYEARKLIPRTQVNKTYASIIQQTTAQPQRTIPQQIETRSVATQTSARSVATQYDIEETQKHIEKKTTATQYKKSDTINNEEEEEEENTVQQNRKPDKSEEGRGPKPKQNKNLENKKVTNTNEDSTEIRTTIQSHTNSSQEPTDQTTEQDKMDTHPIQDNMDVHPIQHEPIPVINTRRPETTMNLPSEELPSSSQNPTNTYKPTSPSDWPSPRDPRIRKTLQNSQENSNQKPTHRSRSRSTHK